MRETLTISAVAKQTGVSSKTLRYWESLGLMPRAERSHTGYRLFDPDCLRYVAFIQQSKSIGLTLGQMARILDRARIGGNPCPEVLRWTQERVKALDEQIEQLTALRLRLKRVCGKWARAASCPPGRSAGVCYLVRDLPIVKNSKGGKRYAKTMVGGVGRAGHACA